MATQTKALSTWVPPRRNYSTEEKNQIRGYWFNAAKEAGEKVPDEVMKKGWDVYLDEFVQSKLPAPTPKPSWLTKAKEFLGLKNLKPAQWSILGGSVVSIGMTLLMSDAGIISKMASLALDGLGVAAAFFPPLLLPVAGLYALRGAYNLLKGETTAGISDIACAAFPMFSAPKKLFSMLKAGHLTKNTLLPFLVREGFGRAGVKQFGSFINFFKDLFTNPALGIAKAINAVKGNMAKVSQLAQQQAGTASNLTMFGHNVQCVDNLGNLVSQTA